MIDLLSFYPLEGKTPRRHGKPDVTFRARDRSTRGRRRIRGADTTPTTDAAAAQDIVEAFLAAARDGDFDALVAVLDPDVVLRVDRGAVPRGASREVRGAQAVVEQARTFAPLVASARPALVNGAAGVVVAPRGRPVAVAGFTIAHGRIVEIDLLADPARLRNLDLTVLDD
jgi:RNA polymerase sigma-70 factor, ECF subfamily